MSYIREKILKYPLRSIYFYPTESCNLKCKHCWIQPDYVKDDVSFLELNRNNVSVETMERVARDAIPLGLNHIKFTGGEPFLHPGLFGFMDCFSKHGLSISFETNGTLLTEDIVEKLTKYDVKMISVSLDGSVPEVHDRIRGVKGSFKSTLNGIRLLIKHGIYPQVVFCLQKLNEYDLMNTIRLISRWDIKSFEINPLALSGRTVMESGCAGLKPEELLHLEKKIEGELSEQYPDMHIDLYLPPALKGIKELSRNPICTCKIHTICGILSNGDVSICGIGRRKRELIMGNVKEKSIGEIWEKGLVFKEIREKVPSQIEGVCGKCLFKYHCLGFCRVDVIVSEMPLIASYGLCEEVFQKGLFPGSRILGETESLMIKDKALQ